MGRAKDPFYVPHLLELLEDKNSIVRFCAAESLGWYPKKKDLSEKALLKALDDTNSTVRLCATEALGDIQSKKAVPKLKRIAENEKKIVLRLYAIDAIGYIGDKKCVKWLESRMAKENDEIKVVIYNALIELGEYDYYLDLIELLDSNNYRVRLSTISYMADVVSNYIDKNDIINDLLERKKKEKSKKCLKRINEKIKELKE